MPSDYLNLATQLAQIIGPIVTALLAFGAFRTARAAAISAEVTKNEFELVHRPFVCVEWSAVDVSGKAGEDIQIYAEGQIVGRVWSPNYFTQCQDSNDAR